MKLTLSKFVFWIVLVVILLVIGAAYFVVVRPVKKETDQLDKELEQQISDLKRFAEAPKIVNDRWFKNAKDYVSSVKDQNKKCFDYLKQFRYDWDRPFEGAKPAEGQKAADKDVFKYIYGDIQKKFAAKAESQIQLRSNCFRWPDLAEGSEERILFIQRYCWVQDALFDVVIAGQSRELILLELQDLPLSDEGKSLFQVSSFHVKVLMPYRDLPALVASVLSLDRKFLCYIDSLRVSKDQRALPTLRRNQPLEEPLVEVSLYGRMFLFQQPPAPAAKAEPAKSS
ncbi:MAG: hypothetical protein HYU36_12975 [Planctomycetes bacterium]|nr:hypothetical protein [Planctomycetota bacterium]